MEENPFFRASTDSQLAGWPGRQRRESGDLQSDTSRRSTSSNELEQRPTLSRQSSAASIAASIESDRPIRKPKGVRRQKSGAFPNVFANQDAQPNVHRRVDSNESDHPRRSFSSEMPDSRDEMLQELMRDTGLDELEEIMRETGVDASLRRSAVITSPLSLSLGLDPGSYISDDLLIDDLNLPDTESSPLMESESLSLSALGFIVPGSYSSVNSHASMSSLSRSRSSSRSDLVSFDQLIAQPHDSDLSSAAHSVESSTPGTPGTPKSKRSSRERITNPIEFSKMPVTPPAPKVSGRSLLSEAIKPPSTHRRRSPPRPKTSRIQEAAMKRRIMKDTKRTSWEDEGVGRGLVLDVSVSRGGKTGVMVAPSEGGSDPGEQRAGSSASSSAPSMNSTKSSPVGASRHDKLQTDDEEDEVIDDDDEDNYEDLTAEEGDQPTIGVGAGRMNLKMRMMRRELLDKQAERRQAKAAGRMRVFSGGVMGPTQESWHQIDFDGISVERVW